MRDLAAEILHYADVLVAHGQPEGDGLRGPLVPLPDMHIGPADRGFADTDEHVAVTDGRRRDVGQPQALAAFLFY